MLHVVETILSCLLIFTIAFSCVVADETAYTVGSGDSVEVEVGGESTLSGVYKVSGEGTIVYPLLGELKVSGLSASGIASELRTRLAKDYLVDPQVVAYVKDYASQKVAVLGDISSPGFYVLKGDSSLLSLLSQAGLALATSGSDTTIIITRQGKSDADQGVYAPVVLKLEKLLTPWQEEEAVLLRGGERVFVKSGAGGKVIVSGKVKKPGVVALTEGLRVLEAINRAGGLADYGSSKGIRVVRESSEGSEVLNVDLDEVMDGDTAKDLELKDGDIIVVPRRWF